MVTRLSDPYLVSGILTATVGGKASSYSAAPTDPLLVGGQRATTVYPLALVDIAGSGYLPNLQGGPGLAVSPSNAADANDGSNYFAVGLYSWNGVNRDRVRNNETAVLLASAASTVVARTAADQINYDHAGVMLLLNIYGTASTATIGGVIVQAKHNDKYATLTAFARTLTAPGLYPFAFHPGAGAGTLVSGAAPMILPRDWRAIVSGALDANASAAYQLDAHYVGYGGG